MSRRPARSATSARRLITSWWIARSGTRGRVIIICRPAAFADADPSLIALAQAAFARCGCRVHTGSTWTTDAPFRETAESIALRRDEGILAVEMEAAALYAFASACGRPVVCLAHVSNRLGCVEGDFEKGDGNGVCGSVELVTRLASAWLQAERVGTPGPETAAAE
jgi:nucleoside phosphorylase